MLRQTVYTLATVLTLGVASLGITNDAEAARGDGNRGDRSGQHNADRHDASHNDHRVNHRTRGRDVAHSNHGRHDRGARQNGHYRGHKKAHRNHRGNAKKHARQHARNDQYGHNRARHSNRYYNKHYRKHYRNTYRKHARRHYTNHRYYHTNYNHYRSWQPYFGSMWQAYQLTGWQRANGCHPVVKMRGNYRNSRLVGATMCYDNWGEAYIVPHSRSVLYRYH